MSYVLQQRQEPTTYTNWIQAPIVLSLRELEVEVDCAKANPVEVKVGKIDTGWRWHNWEELFVTMMGSMMG